MSEEVKYTRDQFMDMIKEGLIELNKWDGVKKPLRSDDYTVMGKVSMALSFYFKYVDKQKTNETEPS